MPDLGTKRRRGPASSGLARAITAMLTGGALLFVFGAPPAGSAEPAAQAVLPCKRDLALTAIYRAGGTVRFEGVATPALRGRRVKIHEIRSGNLVATTTVRRDGTWWARASTVGRGYTWLTKFVAESGRADTRWRRLGQAVAIRDRGAGRREGRVRIKVKVSGDSPDRIVVSRQTGCSRDSVRHKFALDTGPEGVASIGLPMPAAGEPYSIYRVSNQDGLKISPPIVVRPIPSD